MKEREFKDLLKEKAESFEMETNAAAFDTIISERKKLQQKPRRKLMVFLWFAAIVPAVIFAYYLGSKSKGDKITNVAAPDQAIVSIDPIVEPSAQAHQKEKINIVHHDKILSGNAAVERPDEDKRRKKIAFTRDPIR